MAKYARLQRLLKDQPDLDLSFYPTHLLHLRSILSDWVETKDLVELYTSESKQEEACKEILDEALKLLQDKIENGNGFEFHIRKIVADLKIAYEDNPSQFVEDLYNGLLREDQLTNPNMTSQMMVDGDMEMSDLELSTSISQCVKDQEKVIDIVNRASEVLCNWNADIMNSSAAHQDIFGNGQIVDAPITIFQKLRKNLRFLAHRLVDELSRVIMALHHHIRLWQRWQLYQCVSRKPVDDSEAPDYVISMCEQVCQCVSQLYRCSVSPELQSLDAVRENGTSHGPTVSSSAWFGPAVKRLIASIVEKFLVVMEQPPVTMMIEKEKSTKDKNDDTNSSKKFKTKVGLLGGAGFKNTGLQMKEVEIYLALNHDLARSLPQNTRPTETFMILIDRPSRQASARSYDSPRLPYERSYEKLRVEGYRRAESKNVYKMLYHVVYDITFEIQLAVSMEFKSQVYSLPIVVRTGAVQASEHAGVLLWHSFAASNVYDLHAEVAGSMTVSQLVELINERLLFIGGRGLQQYEVDFLQNRIRMAASVRPDKNGSSDTITLDTFIKDKVMLPRHGTAERDRMEFSLWRWIHAVINLLENTLLQPWVDGVIYGFASRDQCAEVLQNEPEGTFLLRFSESLLEGNHALAKGGVAVVLKSGDNVHFFPPLPTAQIDEKGLVYLLQTNVSQCQTLYGKNWDMETLMSRYPPIKPDGQTVQDLRYCRAFADNLGSLAQADSPRPAPQLQSVPRKPLKKVKRPSKSKGEGEVDTKQYRSARAMSPESTTSSVASPFSMNPMSPPIHQFQPVGFFQRQTSSSSYGSPPTPTNIPTTVMSQMTLGAGAGAGEPLSGLSHGLEVGQDGVMELELEPGLYQIETDQSMGAQGTFTMSGIINDCGPAPTNFLLVGQDPSSFVMNGHDNSNTIFMLSNEPGNGEDLTLDEDDLETLDKLQLGLLDTSRQ